MSKFATVKFKPYTLYTIYQISTFEGNVLVCMFIYITVVKVTGS